MYMSIIYTYMYEYIFNVYVYISVCISAVNATQSSLPEKAKLNQTEHSCVCNLLAYLEKKVTWFSFADCLGFAFWAQSGWVIFASLALSHTLLHSIWLSVIIVVKKDFFSVGEIFSARARTQQQ